MRKFVFLFFLLASITLVSYGQIEFKASAPQSVIIGEPFKLTYELNAEGKEFRIPEMPDFQILMGPVSNLHRSFGWDSSGNSVSEYKQSYTYTLLATKEGTFTLPEANVKVNNANYKSNKLTVKVLPADQQPATSGNQQQNSSTGNTTSVANSDNIFVRMSVSKTNVYEQESFLVTFKLYTKGEQLRIQNLKFPEFEGFLVQDIELPQNRSYVLENYNGQNYYTIALKQSVLFPQRSGQITIGKGEYDLEVSVRVPRANRPRSFFDDFFDDYRQERRIVTTSPVTINVKPLPSGKPANFSGGVGEFTMKTSLSADHVKANNAITVKVDINGSGNIRLVKNPEIIFPNDFDDYDPKIDTDIRTTTSGTTGRKTIEYMAIPRYGGEFQIPSIEFSYFDLKTETYKTLTSDPYKITVEKGEAGSEDSPAVSNYTQRENLRMLGQDIRYLKVKGIHFRSKEEMLFGSFLYLMWYIIPALLFVIFFILYRKQIKENSDLALVRTKKANKTAVKRLKIAGKLLKENKEEAFYEEVLRALWGYLSDKLNIPQSNLTKDNVEVELTRYGVGEELINEFMEILNTCEFARYAPSKASDAMDSLYQLTIDAIGKMENTIKK